MAGTAALPRGAAVLRRSHAEPPGDLYGRIGSPNLRPARPDQGTDGAAGRRRL